MKRRSRVAVLSIAALCLASVTVGPVEAEPANTGLPGGPQKECAVPMAVTTDAEGDQHHRFRDAGGLISEEIVPDRQFDPQTASAERLAKLGLPPRPANSPGATSDGLTRADWQKVATGVAHAVPRPPCTIRGVRATAYSGNFSGYRAIAASGKTYSGAHSSFTAPDYYLSGCSSESMAQWVGVSNDNVLIQAGVYVNQALPTFQAGGFMEIVGGTWDNGELHDVSVPYVVGHRYYFDVHYVDRYDWSFTVSDLDSGASYRGLWTVSSGGGSQYLQPYAYFVSERMTVGGHLTQYMSHSDVRFRAATATIYNEGDARLSVQRPEQVIMLSATGQRLGNVDPLETTESNFTEHWARCGTAE